MVGQLHLDCMEDMNTTQDELKSLQGDVLHMWGANTFHTMLHGPPTQPPAPQSLVGKSFLARGTKPFLAAPQSVVPIHQNLLSSTQPLVPHLAASGSRMPAPSTFGPPPGIT